MDPEHPPEHPKLLDDIADGSADVIALGRKHGLSLTQLADWARDSGAKRTLGTLFALADMQTQVTCTRFRSVAVSQLVRMASRDVATGPMETIRRACKDLLHVDLIEQENEACDDYNDAIKPFEDVKRAYEAEQREAELENRADNNAIAGSLREPGPPLDHPIACEMEMKLEPGGPGPRSGPAIIDECDEHVSHAVVPAPAPAPGPRGCAGGKTDSSHRYVGDAPNTRPAGSG
jgi:hypothetical protein